MKAASCTGYARAACLLLAALCQSSLLAYAIRSPCCSACSRRVHFQPDLTRTNDASLLTWGRPD